MRIDMNYHTFVVERECDNYCNSSVSECPWSSAQNIFLFHFWFMFWRDNFLISLIRASPGTVLKVFFPPIIGGHDKVHILLIMEALGKYKETVYSLKLPHPNAQIYSRFWFKCSTVEITWKATMTHTDLWNLFQMSSLWKLGSEEFIRDLWVA